MPLEPCRECGHPVSTEAAKCPHCGVDNPSKTGLKKKSQAAMLGCLLPTLAVLGFCVYAVGSYDPSTASSSSTGAGYTAPDTTPVLELLSSRGEKTDYFFTVEGQVKNISGVSLDNVTAVVTILDGSGQFVTTDDALIDFDPILPGQTSPFSVIATVNPAMEGYTVEFKELMGGSLRTRDSR